MSLVTYTRPIITLRLRDFLVKAGLWLANVFDAIAEGSAVSRSVSTRRRMTMTCRSSEEVSETKTGDRLEANI